MDSNHPNRNAKLRSDLDQEIAPYLRKMGFSCVIHDNPRADAGSIPVAHRSKGVYPTIFMPYRHGDVAAGYDDQWHDTMGNQQGRLCLVLARDCRQQRTAYNQFCSDEYDVVTSWTFGL